MALDELSVMQARQIAAIAKKARDVKVASFGAVPEQDFGEMVPAHGERDSSRMSEFEDMPLDAPEISELRRVVNALAPTARRELYVLMGIGKGDYASGTWTQGLVDADPLSDDTIAGAIIEDIDLHDHILKALYELDEA